MKKIGLIAVFLSLAIIVLGAEELVGKVISVFDGNTFELQADDNELYKIMLYGVDCPELGQPFASEAKKELEKLILNQKISVQIKGKDRLGVRLGVVTIKEIVDPRKILLKNGLAWTAEQNPLEELEAIRLEANANKNGIWTENNPTPPWIYRREQSMLRPKSS